MKKTSENDLQSLSFQTRAIQSHQTEGIWAADNCHRKKTNGL